MNEEQAAYVLLEAYASGVEAHIHTLGNGERVVITDTGTHLWCEKDLKRYRAGTLVQERTA